MVSDKKLANAVGGKTARACDSCIRKRARWYCAADDAFLCQACDASVHSANPLARRHHRVRLKTASLKSCDESHLENLLPNCPSFTKKARTPRHGKHSAHGPQPKSEESVRNPLPFVPEMVGDDISNEENEEQLLYRVPIFDPFVAELCTSENSNKGATRMAINDDASVVESKALAYDCGGGVNNLNGFLPSDMDLEDFAADVESLLGKSLDEEVFDMGGLGLVDFRESSRDQMEGNLGSEKVKVEYEEEEVGGAMVSNGGDIDTDMTFEFRLDYGSLELEEEEAEAEEQKVVVKGKEEYKESDVKDKILLRLDYEGVIAAWADQKSPWTTGDRPQLHPTDCWPDCMGTCGTIHHLYGDIGAIGGHSAMLDRGREARVSRYREKRRTRLFSKKIRYQVRKLNAEKRPRMKGRFVKRATTAGPSFPMLIK